MPYENQNISDVENNFNTNINTGLSSEEAAKRLNENGQNTLPEKKRDSFFKTFISQFLDPMIYILLAAILINVIFLVLTITGVTPLEPGESMTTSVLESVAEISIILIVIVTNALIGTIQERKAMKAIESLNKMAAPSCFVKRDGVIIEIKAFELVVGDIVILEEGNIIPADVRLIKAINLKCDEASLTGESTPVTKDSEIVFSDEVGVGDRLNCAYMSSIVSYGRGEGIVIGTGIDTEIGKVAKLLDETSNESTPLQKKLAKLSKSLGLLCIGIVILMILVDGVIRNAHWGETALWFQDFANSIKGAIALAVAAIPEGLVAVVTIVLALGMQRLAKVNTIVRKLPSVETLGSVSTICSDKTGTLTQNKMTVIKVNINGENNNVNNIDVNKARILIEGFALSSNAKVVEGHEYGDPTEVALIHLALNNGINDDYLDTNYPRIDEYPFDSVRKMMSTLHKSQDKTILYTKGAIDQILKNSAYILENGQVRKITAKDIANINENAKKMSDEALRVLAIAYKETDTISETDLVFIGFVGMIDPPRPEAYSAIETLKGAGITTIMITGDHIDTAYAIAKDLKIVERIDDCYLGAHLDKLSEDELRELVKTARVFARVSPTNKTQIVNALKANGEIVAMTGDGVNDAPSLKVADIGIAMGITGTDVAKGAADMVLADDNFASIEKAVEEGRGIFANIKKTVIFLLSSNLAEVIAMFVSICIGLGSPLSPIHVLWVNLVTDSLPAVALGMDEKDEDIMERAPAKSDESLFSHGGLMKMIFYGVLIAILTLGIYVIAVYLCGGSFDLLHGGIVLGPNGVNQTIYDAIVANNGGIVPDNINDMMIKHIQIIARTSAFCVLAMSELFHMFGMSSERDSFFHNLKRKPKLIFIAFALGIVLQLGVCFIPGVNTFFGTDNLFEIWPIWFIILGFSVLPFVIHETSVIIRKIARRRKNR